MREKAIKVALALASAIWLSGCGAVLNLWSGAAPSPDGPGWRPYGGVVNSLLGVKMNVEEAARLDKSECALNAAGALWFLAVDTPLSAAVDTLTVVPLGIGDLLDKRIEKERWRQAPARQEAEEATPDSWP